MTEYVIGNPPGKLSKSVRKTRLVVSFVNINNTCPSGALNISLLKNKSTAPKEFGRTMLEATQTPAVDEYPVLTG